MEQLIGALGVVLLFGAIVVVHEFGHFIVAKMSGMDVPEFSIGFGPALLSITRGGTLYAIRALPLGGYVRIAGMETEDPDAQAKYNRIPFYKKFATIFAGSAMNFVLAFIVLAIVIMVSGLDKTRIAEVAPNTPAAEAGLQGGDVIYAINGKVNPMSQLTPVYIQIAKPPVEMVVIRQGERVTVQTTPRKLNGEKTPRIGVALETYREPVSAPAAVGAGGRRVYEMTAGTVEGIGLLLSGKGGGIMGPFNMMRSTGNIANQAAKNLADDDKKSADAVVLYFWWLALISVSIGFFNLLPIPALDGSRLIFLTAEAIRGKPFNREKEAMVHLVGMALLLSVVLFVTFGEVKGYVKEKTKATPARTQSK